jgi:hypothetical protein
METTGYEEMSGMSGFTREGHPGESARLSERGSMKIPGRSLPGENPTFPTFGE